MDSAGNRLVVEEISMMEGWMGSWGAGSMGWWGGAWMILFWILVIAGIVVGIRWMTTRSESDKNNRS
ncbi:MAG: hypothetical protein ABIR73_16600 [Usitatibacter sp.]